MIFILKSKKRRKILELMEKKPVSPSEVAKLTDDHLSSVSRSFLELAKGGFIKCINPNDLNFRFYKLTKKGKEALKKLKEMRG